MAPVRLLKPSKAHKSLVKNAVVAEHSEVRKKKVSKTLTLVS